MTTLSFAVRQKEAVLVRPAAATPRETKLLSNLDCQRFLRRHVPLVFFYRGGGDHRDPVAVIRRALGEALVPYYPLAGRLREAEGRKLVVDCTGEGVLFVEADADVRLAELEAAGLRPPFPCMDQLLLDFVQGSSCPLVLVQVTRLLCGGVVVALRVSHIICDGTGTAQFMNAVAELARGLPSPTVPPAWSRELLLLRAPPTMMTTQQAPSWPSSSLSTSLAESKVIRTFTFGPSEIATIKARLPPRLRESATTFEVLTAALWRARTAALQLSPDQQVGLLFISNLRGLPDLGLPTGYYGNAIVSSPVLATAGELLAGSLADAVAQIRTAKDAVTAESVRSMTEPFMSRLEARLGKLNTFRVSDIRRAGFHRLDFGWGEPVYAGRADGTQHEVTFLVAVNNGGAGGQDNAVAVSVVLPQTAMDRFALEVHSKLLLTTSLSQPAVAQAKL